MTDAANESPRNGHIPDDETVRREQRRITALANHFCAQLATFVFRGTLDMPDGKESLVLVNAGGIVGHLAGLMADSDTATRAAFLRDIQDRLSNAFLSSSSISRGDQDAELARLAGEISRQNAVAESKARPRIQLPRGMMPPPRRRQ